MAIVKKGELILCDNSDIKDGVFLMPSDVTKVGKEAFRGIKLIKIVIPDSVTEIDSGAFADCEELVQVMLSKNLKKISRGLFHNCKKLSQIIILDGITEIGDGAFLGCEKLTHLTIPGSVIEIGDGAFLGGKEIVELTILEGVRKIGNWTFSKCEKLTYLIIPGSVIEIGEGAFAGGKEIVELTILEGVEKIGSWAFKDCKKLNQLIISESVLEIGEGAFDGCENIENIYVDTVSDTELQRIKSLFPDNLKDKVHMKPIQMKLAQIEPVKMNSLGMFFYLHRIVIIIGSLLAGLCTLGLLLLRKPKHQLSKESEVDEKSLFSDPNIAKSRITGFGAFNRLKMEQKLIGVKPSDVTLLKVGVNPEKLEDARRCFGRKSAKE